MDKQRWSELIFLALFLLAFVTIMSAAVWVADFTQSTDSQFNGLTTEQTLRQQNLNQRIECLQYLLDENKLRLETGDELLPNRC